MIKNDKWRVMWWSLHKQTLTIFKTNVNLYIEFIYLTGQVNKNNKAWTTITVDYIFMTCENVSYILKNALFVVFVSLKMHQTINERPKGHNCSYILILLVHCDRL